MDDLRIERFDREKHQRDEFRSGKPSLDDFLHARVSQYEKRKLGKTYVAVCTGATRVLGYYTISSSSLQFAHLPEKVAKKLPKHPVPAILLARLAVDQSIHGQGLGSDLLLDALHRIADISTNLGVFAVEVDAIDQDALAFYQRFGFQSLLDDELHLFMQIETVEKMARGK